MVDNRVLGTAAASTGSILIPCARGLGAEPTVHRTVYD